MLAFSAFLSSVSTQRIHLDAITYSWDNAGRLASTTAGGKTLGYQYDDLSRRTTTVLGNGGSTTRSYSAQGALASLKHFTASTASDVQYTYSRNPLRELTQTSWSNNAYQWSPGAPSTKAYAANNLNQYTSAAGAALSYEANGSLAGDGAWAYGYDADNRLRTASKTSAPAVTAALSYDAEGRLRQSAITTAPATTPTTVNLLYSGTALVAEYDAANASVVRRYVHGPGSDEPIVWYEGAGTAAKNWLLADHLGSVVGTTNAAGASTGVYSYGPYGEPATSGGASPAMRFRYTGQQWFDGLGLYYYKARFYAPALGRFLQTDPIGYADQMNLYAYVGNNPGNQVDPSGLCTATSYPVPQSNVQGTALGPWLNLAPLPPEPGLERVYPEQYLVGGGIGGGIKLVGKGVATEAAAFTEISFGVRATKKSATQLNVNLTQTQAIDNLAANGFSKAASKDGTVTIMNNGDKTYSFYPSSTGGGVAGAESGVPSALVSVTDKIVTKLRFRGE